MRKKEHQQSLQLTIDKLHQEGNEYKNTLIVAKVYDLWKLIENDEVMITLFIFRRSKARD